MVNEEIALNILLEMGREDLEASIKSASDTASVTPQGPQGTAMTIIPSGGDPTGATDLGDDKAEEVWRLNALRCSAPPTESISYSSVEALKAALGVDDPAQDSAWADETINEEEIVRDTWLREQFRAVTVPLARLNHLAIVPEPVIQRLEASVQWTDADLKTCDAVSHYLSKLLRHGTMRDPRSRRDPATGWNVATGRGHRWHADCWVHRDTGGWADLGDGKSRICQKFNLHAVSVVGKGSEEARRTRAGS